MPTTREDKPVAKPRQRSRKPDQRNRKSEKKAEARSKAEVRLEADPVSAIAAPIEPAQAEITPLEVAQLEVAQLEVTRLEVTPAEITPVEVTRVDVAPVEVAPVAMMVETARDPALSGEVLPPEVRERAPATTGAQAIALAYGDYTRKSALAGRFLVERLMTVRSFDEAIEIQSEFARQTYANFLTHSERIGELYGAWTRQCFKPLGILATEWPRISR